MIGSIVLHQGRYGSTTTWRRARGNPNGWIVDRHSENSFDAYQSNPSAPFNAASRFRTSGSSIPSSAARFFPPPFDIFPVISAVIGVFHQIGPPCAPSPDVHEMHPVRTFGVSCGWSS